MSQSQPSATGPADALPVAAPKSFRNANDDDAPTTNAAGEQIVKRKVCITFGYVGERYCGLQYVKEAHINTVERELLGGLMRSGYLAQCNVECDNPMQKLAWERASRTDKGVHALKNLVSLKLQVPLTATETNDFTKCVADINKALPSDVRVYKIQQVTGSFNAYQLCHGRRYQYYLPTFALCSKAEYDAMLPHEVAPQRIVDEEVLKAEPVEGEDGPQGAIGEKRPRDADEVVGDEPNPATSSEARSIHVPAKVNNDIKYGGEPMNVYKTIPKEAMQRLAQYRISPENLERARTLFGMYVGTKPYHNFTPGGKPADKSTIRYIQRVTVNDPEVLMPSLPEGCEDEAKLRHLQECYPTGLEWVRVEIEGQSFMLNQIRKMVGNVICVMILGLPDYFVSDSLQTNVIRGIPMAPANGLFLSYLNFSIYNKKLDTMRSQSKADGKPYVDMDFDVIPVDEKLKTTNPEQHAHLVAEQEATRAEVNAMHKQILATVGRRECCEDITGRWLRSARHVCRLCYRMEFGPDDDPLRCEKAPAPIATRTAPRGFRAETSEGAAAVATTGPIIADTEANAAPAEPASTA